MDDYRKRSYLSAAEAAGFLGLTVALVHDLAKEGRLPYRRAASGQMRFRLEDLKRYLKSTKRKSRTFPGLPRESIFELDSTTQRVYLKNSQQMDDLPDNSVHLMITSPPYFNAKMYSPEPLEGDLGNIHDMDVWFSEIAKVWTEVLRVLQPGRKAFINIMNLPVRLENGFKTLNLVGKTIELCDSLGFIFKRDIIWQKTNSVRAHFGTYPYPGGILLNHNHEFILEFEKPAPSGYQKYAHLTKEQKEASRLDKAFWIEIKKSDVWVMKPQGSGDRRNHVAPFPYELPYRLIKAY
ncbi:MAG: DNA methyltransferase, partial [Candidatus Hydrothermia bacterium]